MKQKPCATTPATVAAVCDRRHFKSHSAALVDGRDGAPAPSAPRSAAQWARMARWGCFGPPAPPRAGTAQARLPYPANGHAAKIISCAAAVSDYLASMDWQQLVSLAIVGAAAALLLRVRFRPRKF